MESRSYPCNLCGDKVVWLQTKDKRRIPVQPGRVGKDISIYKEGYHQPHSDYCEAWRKQNADKLLEG